MTDQTMTPTEAADGLERSLDTAEMHRTGRVAEARVLIDHARSPAAPEVAPREGQSYAHRVALGDEPPPPALEAAMQKLAPSAKGEAAIVDPYADERAQVRVAWNRLCIDVVGMRGRNPEEVVDHIAAALAAKPEVVTGEQAAQLPLNSIVVECYRDGQPVHGYMPHVVRKNKQRDAPDGDVRVLYRAPEPTITVGQTITTAAELDACPVGTIVLSEVASRAVHVLMTYGWSGAGSDGEWAPALPARVLDLPGADSPAAEDGGA